MRNMLRCRAEITRWLAVACSSFLCCIGQAQELEPLRLLFVDSYGEHVAGVEADPGSFVFQGDPGLSFGVNDLKTADGGRLISDEEGAIEIPVPNYGLGELVRFKLNAKHDSYAQLSDWVQVNVGGVTQVELAVGVRIAVTAVAEETGQSLRHGLFAIAEQKDLDQMLDWKSNRGGLLVSRRLRVSDQRIRLAQIVDGKPLRFSDAIDVQKSDGERTFVRDVPMAKALQFSGRLHDRVPRPVRHGLISVCVAWPTQTELEKYGPAGHWLAHSKIAEDGTFLIQGLPAGSWIQVIASCDGWYSQASDAKLRMSAFPGENRLANIEDSILPALYEFKSSLSDAVIDMQPAASAKILCTDADETPMAETKIFARRSQRFFHGSWASRTFRNQVSTLAELQATRRGIPYQPHQNAEISGTTDASGIAHISNLPGTKFLLRVDGHPYKDGRIWKSVTLDRQGRATVTVEGP